MKYRVTLLVTVAASALAAASVHAKTLVSTIDGGYDQDYYDTPSLNISNTTPYDFVNAQIVLTGYQGDNKGVTQTVALGTISSGTVDDVIWGISASNGYPVPTGGPTKGQLFTYDYDDSEGEQVVEPGCAAEGYSYCAYVGNFSVKFTATWMNPAYGSMGTLISAAFTPAINATGGFVGWEGLDPSGLSETTYDAHVGTPNGILANIYVGETSVGVPEPAAWTMLLLGFGGIGFAARRARGLLRSVSA